MPGRSSDGAQRQRAGSRGGAGVRPGRAGAGGRASGWDEAWRRVLALRRPGGSARHLRLVPREALRSSEPAGGAVATTHFRGRRGPEVSQSLPTRSSGSGGGPGGRGGWTGSGKARPTAALRAHSASRPRREVRPPGAAMPFLHGFRRIIFEYQPLVDAILGSLGIQDPERQGPLDG